MKNNNACPPRPQTPKISEKDIAEYASLPKTEREALSKRPEFKRYHSRYEEMSRKQAEQEAEKRSQDAQRIKDKKQAHIHDFAVAAFGSAFALFLEHLDDIVHFIKRLF